MAGIDPLGLKGLLLEGHVTVERALSETPLAVTYRAVYRGIGGGVSLKAFRLSPKVSAERGEAFVEALARQAASLETLAASADFPALVSFGSVRAADVLVPYLATDWVEGQSLFAELELRTAAMPLAEVATWFADALTTLEAAHSRGLVHGDLCAATLAIDKSVPTSPRLRITDFGVAALLDEWSAEMATGVAGPSTFEPKNAAPEQLDGSLGAPGPSSDVFALSLVMLETLLPRLKRKTGPLAHRKKRSVEPQDIPTPKRLGLALPPRVAAVFDRALATRPADRYATAGELLQALREADTAFLRATVSRPSRRPPAASANVASSPVIPRSSPSASVLGATPSMPAAEPKKLELEPRLGRASEAPPPLRLGRASEAPPPLRLGRASEPHSLDFAASLAQPAISLEAALPPRTDSLPDLLAAVGVPSQAFAEPLASLSPEPSSPLPDTTAVDHLAPETLEPAESGVVDAPSPLEATPSFAPEATPHHEPPSHGSPSPPSRARPLGLLAQVQDVRLEPAARQVVEVVAAPPIEPPYAPPTAVAVPMASVPFASVAAPSPPVVTAAAASDGGASLVAPDASLPAPPAPPAPLAPLALSTDPGDDDAPAPPMESSRTLVMVGAAVAFVGLLGLVAFALRGSSSEQKMTNHVASSAPVTSTTAATPTTSTTPATPTSVPSAPTSPIESSPSPSVAIPAPSTAGPSGDGSFNRAGAQAALEAIPGTQSECRKLNGPRGKWKATVTFEPTGAVSDIDLEKPFGRTPSGKCVKDHFKGAVVPPFSGPPQKVTLLVTIAVAGK